MRLLMIDNYDSFTYNLVQLFREFDIDVKTFRHDALTVEDVEAETPDWICISPGPKTPAHSGISKEIIRRMAGRTPILGVCLGMQVINEVYGGSTEKAPLPVHGKRHQIRHSGNGLFEGLPSPFQAARYHSLQCIMNSGELLPLAWSEDDVVMALMHRDLPVFGVQFHPESFMTEYGLEIVEKFLLYNPNYKGSPAGYGIHSDLDSRFPRACGGSGEIAA